MYVERFYFLFIAIGARHSDKLFCYFTATAQLG